MEDLDKVIKYLEEVNQIRSFVVFSKSEQFRALRNITMPIDLQDWYYECQDKILQEELHSKKITKAESFKGRIVVWFGDITTIEADAIVNACNSKLLGCFQPLHNCVDNAIHSAAGLQVRRDLMEVMEQQGYDEPNGRVKVTRGYNLPSRYIFHTVGPVAGKVPSSKNQQDLKSCYEVCLKQADELKLKSIAFCNISTGVYGYPIQEACSIAIKTVKEYLENSDSMLEKVIFTCFSKGDYDVYVKEMEKLD